MNYPAFAQRSVTLRTLEEVYADFDEFITEGSSDRRWEVFELTQSQDVNKWIADPAMIETIGSNLQLLVEVLRAMPRPVKIIDVGCYGGYLYDYLRAHVFTSSREFNYVGIDVQEEVVSSARDAHREFENAEFLYSDVFKLRASFEPEAFDVVFCSRVLIHLPYFEQAVRNLFSISRNVVFLIVKIENRPVCKKILETDCQSGKEVVYFVRTFSKEMIKNITRGMGLSFEIYKGGFYNSVLLRKYPKKKTLIFKKIKNWFGVK